MTRYLKQTAQLERVVRNEHGEPVRDAYGAYSFEPAVTVKCRREPANVNTTMSNGQFINYSDVYYVDETTPVSPQDKLDGNIVLGSYPYVDGKGQCIGYEVHV